MEVPVADGGEGTVDSLVAARGGKLLTATVEGPLGKPVEAAFGLIDQGRTAVVELAAASGLPLVPQARLLPGAPMVVEAAGLDQALQGSELVFGGEGRVDGQTVYGKGPIEVARRAQAAGVPAVLLACNLGQGWERVLDEGVLAVLPLAEGSSAVEEMIDTAPQLLERAAERACRLIAIGAKRKTS